jgi:hypothetical protein
MSKFNVLGVVTFIFIIYLSFLVYPALSEQESDLLVQFQQWTVQHGKTYASPSEFSQRFQIWKQNLKYINEQNEKRLGYTLAMNEFGDLTFEEFRSVYLMKGIQPSLPSDESKLYYKPMLNRNDIPLSFDWRTKGVVTPVKNQRSCGSCWAFGAAAVIESAYAIAKGILVNLSESELIDCSHDFGNRGCCGGWFAAAFRYVIKNGLNSMETYSYKWGTTRCENYEWSPSDCKANKSAVVARISGFKYIKPYDEDAMLETLARIGPIVVTIDVEDSFRFYRSGIYYGTDCDKTLNHNPVAVGWGSANDTLGIQRDYWLIKNSWGSNWGENGYIRMSRNRNNNCGIATQCGFVIV